MRLAQHEQPRDAAGAFEHVPVRGAEGPQTEIVDQPIENALQGGGGSKARGVAFVGVDDPLDSVDVWRADGLGFGQIRGQAT